jgi:L-alanine-DL-glutamate epimerase-like enolase superfamily enzyme
MQIESFATHVVTLPREVGSLAEAPAQVSTDFVTLRFRTDEGAEGIGYAGFAAPLMTKALKEAVDALAEQVIGDDPMRLEAIGEKLLEIGGRGAPSGLVTRAVSAIDVALWDLKGKVLGQPLWKLLGGYRERVPAYASGHLWRTYDADALARKGAELVEQGFLAMKFRMGSEANNSTESERMSALRDAVGDDIDLMVDINQGWDVNRSIAMGREMEDCGLYWLEDPTNYEDFEGLARIADALDTPIAAGEYLWGVAPFRSFLEHRSVDIVMVDIMRVGGLTQWMKVAHMAQAWNLPVVSHLSPDILAHAVAAVPNGLMVEHMPWSLPLFEEDLTMENGEIVLGERPGLGLEFDERWFTS